MLDSIVLMKEDRGTCVKNEKILREVQTPGQLYSVKGVCLCGCLFLRETKIVKCRAHPVLLLEKCGLRGQMLVDYSTWCEAY